MVKARDRDMVAVVVCSEGGKEKRSVDVEGTEGTLGSYDQGDVADRRGRAEDGGVSLYDSGNHHKRMMRW